MEWISQTFTGRYVECKKEGKNNYISRVIFFSVNEIELYYFRKLIN